MNNYAKIIFSNKENNVNKDVVSYYDNRTIASFGSGAVGSIVILDEYIDVKSDIENTDESGQGIGYLHSSKRETWVIYKQPMSLQQIQCLENLDTISDITYIDQDNNSKDIVKLVVTGKEDTNISGIKSCTFEVLFANNIFMRKGKYNN